MRFPARDRQMPRRDQRIAAIVALSKRSDAHPGLWKKLLHCLRDLRAGLVHQRLRGNAIGKGARFESAHFFSGQLVCGITNAG